MSVLVAVRLPDEIAEQVDARGKRSAVIVEALKAYLGAEPPKRETKQRKAETKPAKVETIQDDDIPDDVLAAVVESSSVPIQKPAEPACKSCGGSFVFMSGAKRCAKCWRVAP